MKRTFAISAVLLFTTVAAHSQNTSWLNGTWQNDAYEKFINTVYPVIIENNVKAGTYNITYPNQGCTGTLAPLSLKATNAQFRETILTGPCTDQGKVVLTKIGTQFMTYSWFDPSSGQPIAYSTLVKQP